MLKIREGNKFTWEWAITRGAGPEDLSQATEIKFSYQFRDKSGRVNITDFTLAGNIISTAFLFTAVQGIVNLRLTYELPVIGPCAVDVDAFEIVASSEEASEGGEFSMTSDMAIALQGKNAYEVWLETHEGTLADYEAWLQQPATDAAASVQGVEQAVEQAEGLRATAESGRVTAEGLRVTAEGSRAGAELLRSGAESDRAGAELLRSGAESDRSGAELLRAGAEDTREMNEYNREDAEALRVQAEIDRQTNTGTATQNASDAAILANTKAGLADTAATNANTKAGLAETAATNADNARLAIQGDLASKENKANKQNSLTVDGTGTKIPTVDAVNAGLAGVSSLRALFVARGAVYNSTTGFYELNGLTDITEAQMTNIYNYTSQSVFQYVQDEMLTSAPIRTTYNRPLNGAFGNTSMRYAYIYSQIEVYKCSLVISQANSCFQNCASLHTVDYLHVIGITNAFSLNNMLLNCTALVTCNLKGVKVNFSFAWSPLLSLASLQYLITNRANGTTPITITVHPTVFAKLTDNTNYPTWYAVNQDALTKYITFASA